MTDQAKQKREESVKTYFNENNSEVSKMSKYKQFWIAPKLYKPIDPVDAEYFVAYDRKGDPNGLEIHVIEHTALVDARAEVEILKHENREWDLMRLDRDYLLSEVNRLKADIALIQLEQKDEK